MVRTPYPGVRARSFSGASDALVLADLRDREPVGGCGTDDHAEAGLAVRADPHIEQMPKLAPYSCAAGPPDRGEALRRAFVARVR